MDKPRWLILTYYANVDGRAASHHIDDRLPAFREAGVEVTLLSSTLGPRHKNEQHLRVYSLLPSAILDELRAGLKRNSNYSLPVSLLRLFVQLLVALPVALLSVVERLLLRRDKRWSWHVTAALRGRLWSLRNKPDVIFTTGGPASAHMAGHWLARKLDVPLVCEFQDPLPYQYPPSDKLNHEYYLQLEAKLAASANALVYLTLGAFDAATKRLANIKNSNSLSAKFAVASGAVPNPAPNKAVGERRVLAHIGSLSGSRNLDAVLEALTALAGKDESLQQRFSVQLAGTLGKSVKQSIESSMFKDQIEILSRQPRTAMDGIIANADILLLIQNTGPIAKETIPSKAFEYLQTGRPIFALIDGNTQLQEILLAHGHTVYDFSESITELQRKLHDVLTKPLASIKPCELTVQHSVNELIRRVESAL